MLPPRPTLATVCTLPETPSPKPLLQEALAELFLGRRGERMEEEKRDAAVVRAITRKLLVALDRLHGWVCRVGGPCKGLGCEGG